MTLRRRTLVFVGLTLAGLLAVLAVVTREMVNRGFLQLEQDQARRDLQRAINAFHDDLTQLSASVEDYGAWDRMVDFAEGRGRALLASEFVPLSLQNLRVHGVVILDQDRRTLFTYGIDPDTGEAASAPPELLEELRRAGGPLLRHAGVPSSAAGVLAASRYPLLIASHPIVTSKGLGPIRGTVVFARYLTPATQHKLAEVTGLSLQIRPLPNRSLPPDVAAASRQLAAGAPDVVRPLDGQRVASYATIPSLQGRPVLVVRVDAPRSVVRQGQVTIRYVVLVLLATGLAFTMLMIGVIQWSVLSPLSRLERGVDGVTASGDLTLRMPTAGPAEFARLAGTMNTMLSALERSDRELRSAREAALRASQEKSDLLANVSHEIRTPMNGVVGMVELLGRTPLTGEQRRYLETVKGSADSLIQIVSDVLDLSKIEAGRFSLSPGPTDIEAVVEQAVRVFVGRAQAKGIALAVRSAAEVPPLVTADGVRVRQIVLNLVGNAVKFTDRGFVEVDVRAAPAPGQDGRVAIEIAVRDTGCGIEASQIGRVFDKFSQAEGARHIGGTGLGLTISRQLAVLMGGDIRVESTVGVGSTFRLLFTAAVVAPSGIGTTSSPAATARPAGSRDGRGLEGTRVLLAEDNPINQEVARLMLEGMGCLVDVVGDGEAAVNQARQCAYDVVLMDRRMPRLDGPAAAAAIRALGGRWSRVPIIAVTADVLEAERERCLQAGMNCVVAKPLRWADLHAALAAGLEDPAGRALDERPAAQAGGEPEADNAEIDWKALDALAQLRRPAGPDPVSHLVTLFLEDGTARLSEMERAAAAGDALALREAAHALKGSCGTVGAVRLRALAADVERTAASGGTSARGRDLCREAREALDRIEPALRRRAAAGDQEIGCGPTAA